MSVQEMTRRTHKIAIMNAVHDLPVLVARDRGFFQDEGLDIEFVVTPGMAQVTSSHEARFESVFDRPLDSIYNEGGIDTYRMCEWGIMKRAVEASCEGLRGRKIVALGASMSKFAIVVSRDSKIYAPEMLKDKEIAVTGKMVGGTVVNTHTVSREAALIAHTRSNAYLFFRENDLGSIQPGRFADLAVTDKDFLTVPAEQIKDIKSVMTIVGGRIVYDAAKDAASPSTR